MWKWGRRRTGYKPATHLQFFWERMEHARLSSRPEAAWSMQHSPKLLREYTFRFSKLNAYEMWHVCAFPSLWQNTDDDVCLFIDICGPCSSDNKGWLLPICGICLHLPVPYPCVSVVPALQCDQIHCQSISKVRMTPLPPLWLLRMCLWLILQLLSLGIVWELLLSCKLLPSFLPCMPPLAVARGPSYLLIRLSQPTFCDPQLMLPWVAWVELCWYCMQGICGKKKGSQNSVKI